MSWLVRPAAADDLPDLKSMLGRAVALPVDADECLLVAVAQGGGPALAGVRLHPGIGLVLPRCWYHVGLTVHAARELNLFHRQRTLLLGNDHTGASELADLAWARAGLPLDEQAALLQLLVGSALLWLAAHRERYASALITELPGLRDSAGQSPFWAGLGRHFYGADPADAERRHGPAWRSHVAALLPRHPVVAAFLPAATQAAIAQVQPAARLLREVLEEVGLRYTHHISVDDAGPVLGADTDALPAVTRSRVWTAAVAGPSDLGDAAEPHLVLAGDAATLRALRAPARPAGTQLQVSAATLQALGASAGQPLWATPLRAA